MNLSPAAESMRVLVVEDDPGQLRTLCDLLADEGYGVEGRSTGAEAIKAAEQTPFAVAVVDLRLPDLDGTELLSKLKERDDDVNVIINTGYGSFDSAKAAVNHGAFAYVEKMRDPGELLRHVHRAMQHRLQAYTRRLESAVALRTAELRESELRFRELADNIDAVFWMEDSATGKLLYVSPAFERLWGGSGESLLQNPEHWFELIHPEDAQRVRLQRAGKLQTGRYESQYRIVRPDGTLLWVYDRGVPIRDASGQIYRFAGLAEDITFRVEAESRMRQQAMELAHAGRLSTVGELAAELAHEINQPLYAIANFAQACMQSLEGDVGTARVEVAQWMRQISQQARRASEILRRLNRFVRKAEPGSSRLSVNSLAKEAASFLDFDAKNNRASIELDLGGDLPEVLGDRILLEQVLVNLMRNGIEAMDGIDPAEKHLRVRTRSIEGAGVEIAVADVGQGLTEDQSRLFEAFFTTKAEGLGLGLSICRSVVEAHGGRIWAADNADRGATFYFTLPAASAVPLNAVG